MRRATVTSSGRISAAAGYGSVSTELWECYSGRTTFTASAADVLNAGDRDESRVGSRQPRARHVTTLLYRVFSIYMAAKSEAIEVHTMQLSRRSDSPSNVCGNIFVRRSSWCDLCSLPRHLRYAFYFGHTSASRCIQAACTTSQWGELRENAAIGLRFVQSADEDLRLWGNRVVKQSYLVILKY